MRSFSSRTWMVSLSILCLFSISRLTPLPNVSAEKEDSQPSSYKVLQPLKSGDLTIFPVVRSSNAKSAEWQYITLDEGLKNGEVIVTEAGRMRGLVRSRGPGIWYPPGDGAEVNRLVLINNSSKPLLLLAGEIVTGGKQDRVIGKDRIVPPQSDPVDLSVFCIEPGRWVQLSDRFGSAGKGGFSFMVQPTVRRQAMVAQDQQKVWAAVGGAISRMAATAPSSQETTSYARTMQQEDVERKVDEAGAPLLQSREQLLAKLRQEHAVGVVVAIRGEIVWADIFATPEMLAKYWAKLVRSYAAEAVTSPWQQEVHVTQEDAERFLSAGQTGQETSVGEAGIYRYSETHSGNITTFVLRSLLPGTSFDVHISKVKTEPDSFVRIHH
ncbi:MAG TPA: DUF6569 family protein [Candidatus Angelobacter sp.]|nr:DUF6569 family protein [Candidatus Angelobacter sp.]